MAVTDGLTYHALALLGAQTDTLLAHIVARCVVVVVANSTARLLRIRAHAKRAHTGHVTLVRKEENKKKRKEEKKGKRKRKKALVKAEEENRVGIGSEIPDSKACK